MAQYDAADLIARCVRYADRPATDRDQTPDDWRAWLSEAQEELFQEWASMPYGVALAVDWTPLVAAEGGRAYLFPGREPSTTCFPLGGVVVKPSPAARETWTPGPEWDPGADFVMAGDRIRFPFAATRSSAPVARYIQPPPPITETQEPVFPQPFRMLLVWRALQKWATKGGLRDPQVFARGETQLWFGNPAQGQHGLLSALQTQFLFGGARARPQAAPHWTAYIDTGAGYPGRPLP